MDIVIQRTSIRRRAAAVGLVVAAPLALLACSDDPPEQAEVQSSAESDSGEQATTTADDGDVESDATESTPTDESEPDATGPPATGPPTESLGSATGRQPATPNDDTPVALRLDVVSIERIPGDAVEVRFTLTNEGSGVVYEPWSTLSDSRNPAFGYDVSGAALVDLEGDKRYLVLADTEAVCLCSDELDDFGIAPDTPAELYAQFPAPPEDVTAIGFTLPGFTPVNGLEIS